MSLMKKISILLVLPFLFSGCLYVNERGIDTRYYNSCKEYYDSMGIHHKSCDKNLIEFQDVKDRAKNIKNRAKSLVLDEPR